jgi:hypothetical protein
VLVETKKKAVENSLFSTAFCDAFELALVSEPRKQAWELVLGGSAACSVRRWQSCLGKPSQAVHTLFNSLQYRLKRVQ